MRRLLAFLALLAAPAWGQVCNQTFSLRSASCPAWSSCQAGTGAGGAISYTDFDDNVLNQIDLCEVFDSGSATVTVSGTWTFSNPIIGSAQAIDADQDGTDEFQRIVNGLYFDPDDDGVLEVWFGAAGNLIFEGSTDDAFETTLAPADPTDDRTITLPDVTGTVVTSGDTDTVTMTMLDDTDTPADEECATYEADSGNIEWQSCGAASGDVTDVGDCSTGACFTADGTGASLVFEGATADAFEVTLTTADPGADYTVTIPAETGTVCTTGSACTGYAMLAGASFTGDVKGAVFSSLAADPADTGLLRDENSTSLVCAEASPAGVDVCLTVNTSEQFTVAGGTFNGGVLTAASVGDNALAAGAVDGGVGGEIADDSIVPADVDETQDYSFTTLSGKQDRNNTAVDDDDCTGEQGLWWYDTTDSAFEFCNAGSGAPSTLGGGGSGAFSDASDPVVLNTTTKEVEIGPTLAGSAKLTVHGDADEVQLLVEGNSTQTSDLAVFRDSAAVNVLVLDPDGAAGTITGQVLLPGPVGSGCQAGRPTLALGDGDSGICERTDDVLIFKTALGSFQQFWLDGSGFMFTTSSGAVVGSARISGYASPQSPSNPPYNFYNDGDTGMYYPGTDQVSLSAGGIEMLELVEAADDRVTIRDFLGVACRSAAPGTPVAGDVYCDSDTAELCFYDGTSWTGLKAGGTCA